MDSMLVRLVKTIMYHGLEAFGRYYSSYRAFVADVEDPDNLQRIKLVVPQISGNQVYNYWAFPKGVFYGDQYGMQCLPEIGDVVWVEFEGGHPEVPIWNHGHPGKLELPKDPDLLDKGCYWFKTPAGHLIKLFDTKNILHIQSSTGHYVEMSADGISVVSPNNISLGTLKKSKEPAVLGDTMMDLLNEFIDDVGNIDLIPTAGGPTQKINLSPKWQILVDKWKDKWKDFKSQKVNLD